MSAERTRLAGRAASRALQRLKAAHHGEYVEFFKEERVRLGLPPDRGVRGLRVGTRMPQRPAP